ncbi:MAG TPA: hypothetical protein VMU84_07655, partial [Thermoanaerobaculia bacterium]|nr:hypothetical protein [Thermoanaerobaculia bacterium]
SPCRHMSPSPAFHDVEQREPAWAHRRCVLFAAQRRHTQVRAENPTVCAENPTVCAENPAVRAENPAVCAENLAVCAENPAVYTDNPPGLRGETGSLQADSTGFSA